MVPENFSKRIELQWKKFLTFPVNVVPSLRSMLSRDKRLPLDTWNLSETQGNVLSIHSIHHRHLIKQFFTPRLQVLQVRFQCR